MYNLGGRRREVGWGLLVIACGWAGHQSAGSEHWYWASLASLGFYSSLFLLLIAITIVTFYFASAVLISPTSFTF